MLEEEEGYYSKDSDADAVLEDMPEAKALALPMSLASGEIEQFGLDNLAGQ